MRRMVYGVLAMALLATVGVLRLSPPAHAQAPAAQGGAADIAEGRRLFQQNCSVCHIGPAHSTSSVGRWLHKGLMTDVDRVRDIINTGRTGMMPGFQYALTPAQVNLMIGYFNTVDATPPPPVPTPAPKVLDESKRTLLAGNIKSVKGDNMEGVTVTARADGQPFTTSVFTDKDGNYYFPSLPSGDYEIWAQAIGFEAGRTNMALAGQMKKQDFRMKDTEDFFLQLNGAQVLQALPTDTPQHRRMKDVFRQQCTTCHTPSLVLRNRYDEAGWDAIIRLMTRETGNIILAARPAPYVEHFRKDLAAYLAEMRGPGPSPMKFKVPNRPTGAATRPVIYEYDIPLDEMGGYAQRGGTGDNWSVGTPSASYGVRQSHDSTIDFNGNIWFTHLPQSKIRSYGRLNPKTGEVTNFTVQSAKPGFVSTSHGMIRDPEGHVWLNLDDVAVPGREEGVDSLGRIDTKTGKVDVFSPPAGMGGVGGHVDFDGKGYMWTSTNTGVLRFDPRTKEWKQFQSKTKLGSATYGIAALPSGGAFWAEIGIDKLGYTDGNAESQELDLPQDEHFADAITEADMFFYKSPAAATPGAQQGPPWHQGVRRMQADRFGDDIWLGAFTGNNLIKVNTKTLDQKVFPLPEDSLSAYMPAVDNSHNVYVGAQGSDTVAMLDPGTEKWTVYQWATRGAAPRHLSVSDRNGVVEVVTSFWGAAKSGRMVMRSEREIQALKSQVQASRAN